MMTVYLTIFGRFATTFRRFPKIPQNLSAGRKNVSEHFRKFLKITEDFRGLPKTQFGEDPKMFWSYTNELKYNLRDN